MPTLLKAAAKMDSPTVQSLLEELKRAKQMNLELKAQRDRVKAADAKT